jgi:hypothetical protein
VKFIKMLGLAMVAAVAAMAFVGAAGAQAAEHDRVGLCKAAELLLCAEKNLINVSPGDGGQLLGTATNPKLVGNLEEVCESSKAVASSTGELDELAKLKFNITSLTFSGCKPCSTVTVATPLAGELTMETIGGENWKYKSAGNAKLTGCPFGVTCKFGTKGATTDIEYGPNKEDTILNTLETVLTLEEGSAFICGSSGKWIAKYLLKWTLKDGTQHNVFPTLLGK